MQRVQELIADPDVKVLIFCQAVVGAKAAVEKARETRDDILYLCGIPGRTRSRLPRLRMWFWPWTSSAWATC